MAGVSIEEASVLRASMVRGIIGGASVVVACVVEAGLAVVFLRGAIELEAGVVGERGVKHMGYRSRR